MLPIYLWKKNENNEYEIECSSNLVKDDEMKV